MKAQNFIRSDLDVAISNYRHLEQVRLKGDDLKGFTIDWSEGLLPYGENPPPISLLFCWYEKQIWKSDQLRQRLTIYSLKCSEEQKDPTYEDYQRLVRIRLEDKEKRNIRKAYEQDERDKPRYGHAGYEAKKSSGKSSTQGLCWSWKTKGTCHKGDK